MKKEIEQVKKGVEKSVSDGHANLKKEIQRAENNAKTFQDNATKKIEKVDTVVVNEMRRVREKTREAIANDTQKIADALFSLKGTVSAAMAMSVISMVLIFTILFKIL